MQEDAFTPPDKIRRTSTAPNLSGPWADEPLFGGDNSGANSSDTSSKPTQKAQAKAMSKRAKKSGRKPKGKKACKKGNRGSCKKNHLKSTPKPTPAAPAAPAVEPQPTESNAPVAEMKAPPDSNTQALNQTGDQVTAPPADQPCASGPTPKAAAAKTMVKPAALPPLALVKPEPLPGMAVTTPTSTRLAKAVGQASIDNLARSTTAEQLAASPQAETAPSKTPAADQPDEEEEEDDGGDDEEEEDENEDGQPNEENNDITEQKGGKRKKKPKTEAQKAALRRHMRFTRSIKSN